MQFSCVHSWFFNILKTISGPVAYQTPSPNTWCDLAFYDDAPADFDEARIAATQYIHQTLSGACEFKIGITENPYIRWTNRGFGYARSGDWIGMVLLYAANTGNKHVHDSSGRMETLLIKEFAGLDVGCLNRVGGGGECASRSSPHFTYVVWRHLFWTHKTETTLKAATKVNMALEMPAKIPPLCLTLRDTGRFIKIPPLGCSKCRYLEFGCTECILRRDEVLSKVGIDTGEPFDVFRDSDVVT